MAWILVSAYAPKISEYPVALFQGVVAISVLAGLGYIFLDSLAKKFGKSIDRWREKEDSDSLFPILLGWVVAFLAALSLLSSLIDIGW